MATETEATHRMTAPGSMRIGLFIPCYVDLLFPEVGLATLELVLLQSFTFRCVTLFSCLRVLVARWSCGRPATFESVRI
jgi:hypothetical protein